MLNFLRDLHHATRTWSRSPGVLAVAVLSLGLGIGAATTIFAVVDTVLFARSQGLDDPETLVRVYTDDPKSESPWGPSSWTEAVHVAESVEALHEVTVSRAEPVTFGDAAPQRILLADRVGWNYFRVLGVRAARGRTFEPRDEGGDDPRLAVLSHRLWTRELSADPDAIGRRLTIGGESYRILGVAPADLSLGHPLRRTDLWIPFPSPVAGTSEATDRRLSILARRDPTASLEQVAAQLEIAAERFRLDAPVLDDGAERSLSFLALAERDSAITPDRRRLVLVLSLFPFGLATLLLLVACSNVATLFLARAERRSRDTALRLALGAGRGRLVSSFFAECLIPGLGCAAVGIASASAALRMLGSVTLPVAVPVELHFRLDPSVLLFAVALALGTTIVFGMAPALAASRPDLVSALRGGRGSGAEGRSRGRRALVVVQVAASVVLVVGAGLFARGADNATRVDLGFDPSGLALTGLRIPDEASETAEAARLWIRSLQERVRSRPEVLDVQVARAAEMSPASPLATRVRPATSDAPVAEAPSAYRNDVTPGYLEMLRTTLLHGRTLDETDTPGAVRAAVINDLFALRLWPEGSALGRSFRAAHPDASGREVEETFTVVGVVRDGKFRDLDDPPIPWYWTSLFQADSPPRQLVLVARGAGDAGALVPVLHDAVPRAADEVVVLPPRTYESVVDLQYLFGRIVTRIFAWGGAFGMFLAALGISGIVAYSVACRRREIALRAAVGATRLDVLRTVARDGIRSALVGAALGALTVVPLAHLLRSQLFGISPADPLTLGGAAVLAIGVTLCASVVPARRALRIDPASALRAE